MIMERPEGAIDRLEIATLSPAYACCSPITAGPTVQPAAPFLLGYSSGRNFESEAVEVLVRIHSGPMRPPIGVIVELQSGCADRLCSGRRQRKYYNHGRVHTAE
jgi:hypothetical protein